MKPYAKSKYRNEPTIYGGVRYDSRAEAHRAAELDLLVLSGTIRFWVRQPSFRLGCPENVYRADFLVVPRSGGAWVEDVKGVHTAKFARDAKLWARYGPCPLHVIGRGGTRVIEGGNGA